MAVIARLVALTGVKEKRRVSIPESERNRSVRLSASSSARANRNRCTFPDGYE